MWNLKYDTMKLSMEKKNRLTNIGNRLVVTKGRGWGRDGWGIWD